MRFQSTTSGVEKVDPEPNRPALYYWCYALHTVLLILQVTLFAMLWSHPEHTITLAFGNSALTVGLSASLQAFYSLYAAFLVFLTQRLVVTDFLSRPQQLTAIHDVSAAWTGLGAAATTLWQQTNIAASTSMTLLTFVYLLCISVLHVASPTIIEFEPYTAIMTMSVPTNSTWPSPSVDLSSFGMSNVVSLLPFVSILAGLSMDGLSNSTLYDTFDETPQMINTSVNAHTIRADCGLLQDLSYASEVVGLQVTASTNGVSLGWLVDPADLASNELWSFREDTSDALFYMVSTAMEVNNTIRNNASLDIVLDLAANGSKADNTSTTVYIVACSLRTSNYTSSLNIQSGNLEPMVDQPDEPSEAWSLWTADEDALATLLNVMMSLAYDTLGNCNPSCYGNRSTLELYLKTMLGIGRSNSAGLNTTSVALTPYQFENALSQMTAQMMWIASKLSEEDGGFTLTESLAQVTGQVPRWRLNINVIPVIFTLSTSFILTVAAFLMLGVPSSAKRSPPAVNGTTVLEMLWVGAHFCALRKRLNMIGRPTTKELRSAGMSQLWLTKSALIRESRTVSEEMSPLTPEIGTDAEVKDVVHGTRTIDDRQIVRWPVHALSFVKSRRLWCYSLHGLFLLLHLVLLLLLIRHPEHSVVIRSVTDVSTTALATSLQFFYVVYTLILVFLTQRLAVSRAVAHPQNLTSVHDLSRVWTGIGSALVGVWQQAEVTSSLRTTLTIVIYYLCVSALHIISTTVIQFEVFDGSSNHIAQSALAWPASGLGVYDWPHLSAIVPLDQLPIFPVEGLVGNTVYDLPTADLASVNATVNATTIRASCGLLTPTLTDYPGDINTTMPTSGPVVISLPEVWKDTVIFLGKETLYNGSNKSLTCLTCGNYLIYWVTTALEVDMSLGDKVNMSTSWLYTPPGQNETSSTTTGYLVACSLNATTTVDVLDIQNDVLTSTAVAQEADASQQVWSLWSPTGGMPSLDSEVSSALNFANQPANSSQFTAYGASFTIMDMYTMSLLGINYTANNDASLTQSSADPTVTLTPSQFEDAISQIATQYVWTTGHTNGNFGPTFGSGESVVTDVITLRRLNVNTIPVVIASVASLVLFVLAVYMVGFGSLESPLSGLGVLETLWLEAHSDLLHTRMRQITDPTLYNLRVGGMFKVCLADEVRGALESSSESLSVTSRVCRV